MLTYAVQILKVTSVILFIACIGVGLIIALTKTPAQVPVTVDGQIMTKSIMKYANIPLGIALIFSGVLFSSFFLTVCSIAESLQGDRRFHL